MPLNWSLNDCYIIKILSWGEEEGKGATRTSVTKDIEPAAKALVVGEPMAIFYPGDGKS